MEQSTPSLSVIIPVYNVEKYIERCARSLFEQTLEQIEYIFIDDCSPDNSIDVLKSVIEDYPKRRDYIVIYKMPTNSGIAAVRKKGIELSKGKFVIHCDSDDWIEPSMYQDMYSLAVNSESDIVVCDYLEEMDNGNYYRKGKQTKESDLGSDCLMLHGYLWNKMVSDELVKNPMIKWPSCNYAEDLVLSFQYSLHSRKNEYLEYPYYHYCRRNDSILSGRTEEKVINGQTGYYNNVQIMQSYLAELSLTDRYKDDMTHLFLGMKNVLLPFLSSDNKLLGRWKSIGQEANRNILSCKLITPSVTS